ncbi:MAG: prepilin-type N-terminal cleavage/methylation domain-containing protein [Phycisphaerae bacterium]|nr:prepilin-type N-terminal cleavage/methylation domain-containing protein [Phycisphaerae bacterium]
MNKIASKSNIKPLTRLRSGHRKTAFTLVELLVVVGIIAILLAILMPSLGKVKATAYRLKCANNLKQIHLAMEMYLGSNDNYFPSAQDPLSTSPFYWLWMGRGFRSFLTPYLVENINEENPSVLHCPQDKSEFYENTSYSYSMSFYHSSAQINSASQTSDNYTNPKPPIAQTIFEVAKPSKKIIIGEWTSNHQAVSGTDKGWWCSLGTRNFLFVDGQVAYIKADEILKARDENPNPNLTINGIKGFDIN